MAKKTAPKKVIDYDPLAWLDESAGNDEEEKQSAAATPRRNKPVVDQSGQHAPAKEPSAAAQGPLADESPGYGFFVDEPEVGSAKSTAETTTETVLEAASAAYGFFADESAELASAGSLTGTADGTIDLGAELTIRSISASKTMIDQALATGKDIRIDISQLQKIDSAGVQMIYSLLQTLGKTTQAVTWVGSNTMLNDAAGLLGMAPVIGDQQADEAYGFFVDETAPEAEEDGAFGFF